MGEGHANGAVKRQELEGLMNKEKYHEHTHSYADTLLEGMQDMLEKDSMDDEDYHSYVDPDYGDDDL